MNQSLDPSHPVLHLASYNVLGDRYIQPTLGVANPFTIGDRYFYVNPKLLDPVIRVSQQIKQIAAVDPDIVALQEVEEKKFDEFYAPELLRLGYEPIFSGRPGVNRDALSAMAYKRSVLNLLLLENVHIGDAHEDGSYTKEEKTFCEANKSALFGFFRHIPSGRLFIAVGIHLSWIENKFEKPETSIPTIQMSYLLARLARFQDRIASEFSDALSKEKERAVNLPVFLMGDFNSTPATNTIRLLYGKPFIFGQRCQRQEDQEETRKRLAGQFKGESFRSAYEDYLSEDRPMSQEVGHPHFPEGNWEDDFDLWKRMPESTHTMTQYSLLLDYVFYQPGRARVLEVKQLATRHEQHEEGGLPDSKEPSDHLLISAKFELI